MNLLQPEVHQEIIQAMDKARSSYNISSKRHFGSYYLNFVDHTKSENAIPILSFHSCRPPTEHTKYRTGEYVRPEDCLAKNWNYDKRKGHTDKEEYLSVNMKPLAPKYALWYHIADTIELTRQDIDQLIPKGLFCDQNNISSQLTGIYPFSFSLSRGFGQKQFSFYFGFHVFGHGVSAVTPLDIYLANSAPSNSTLKDVIGLPRRGVWPSKSRELDTHEP